MSWRAVKASLSLGAMLLFASVASAGPFTEIEANDTTASANNVDGYFSLDFSSDIGDMFGNTSTTIPHVSISGTGNNTVDWYSFTVTTAGSRAIFDVDYGMPNFDSWLRLVAPDGATQLWENDDAAATFGEGGSSDPYDAYFERTFATAGVHYIGVGRYWGLAPIPTGADYVLQLSLENANVAAVPEPTSLLLLGSGVLGEALRARRRRKQRSL